MSTTASKSRTITLTGRPPVRIREDDWPVIASASDKRWDNQLAFQANRTGKIVIRVRQHADGRAIVYGTYDYTSHWQGEPDASYRAGCLLDATPTAAEIVQGITDVAAELAERIGREDRFGLDAIEIGRECIGSLPAEEI